MRLLVFTAFYPPHHSGGYELRCKDMITRLAQRGHKILVVTTRCPTASCTAHPQETGVARVLHERRKSTPVVTQIFDDRADLLAVEQIQKEFQPDLIYLWHIQNLSNAIFAHFAHQTLPLVLDDGGTTASYLHTIQTRGLYFAKNPRDPFPKRLAKTVLDAFARVVSANRIKTKWHWPENLRVTFNGQSGKDLALSAGAPVSDARVIPTAIDLTMYPFQPRDSLNRTIRMILPARIHKEKGVIDAVRLVQMLTAEGFHTTLNVLGEVQSPVVYQSLIDEIHTTGLEDVVKLSLMVSQQDLAQRYRESDICFFPSYFKSGRSRVPLEAMASGCLVISYGNEGSREVITHGEIGFVIPEGDIAAAAKLVDHLSKAPDEYKRMIRNARQIIEQKYGMDNYVDAVESFIMESTAGKSSKPEQAARKMEG